MLRNLFISWGIYLYPEEFVYILRNMFIWWGICLYPEKFIYILRNSFISWGICLYPKEFFHILRSIFICGGIYLYPEEFVYILRNLFTSWGIYLHPEEFVYIPRNPCLWKRLLAREQRGRGKVSSARRWLHCKVKWSRYRPGVAQRVGRGIALLFHDRGTGRGWVVSSTPRSHFTPGKDPVPILHETGWAPGPVRTGGKSRPHRESIPDRPARSQSLYRLSYPAHDYSTVARQKFP